MLLGHGARRRPPRSCSHGCWTRAATAPRAATCGSCSRASTASRFREAPAARAPAPHRASAPEEGSPGPGASSARRSDGCWRCPRRSACATSAPSASPSPSALRTCAGCCAAGASASTRPSRGADRMTVAVTLFALLELYKRGEADWRQQESFGEVTIEAVARPAESLRSRPWQDRRRGRADWTRSPRQPATRASRDSGGTLAGRGLSWRARSRRCCSSRPIR